MSAATATVEPLDTFAPQTRTYKFAEPTEEPGDAVEFSLIYRGKLPAAQSGKTRAAEKQLIRKQLHPQLRTLWEEHPALKFRSKPKEGETRSELEEIADNFARADYRFVPLIREEVSLACALRVQLFRRGGPGKVVQSGGDLDNQLKVLFDALRIPTGLSELGGFFKPEPGEDPFFCLLEDDKLIDEVSIKTERLMTPQHDEEHANDVLAIIGVTARATAWHGLISYGF